MKTIELRIDDSCKHCKIALKRLANWKKQHKSCYGAKNLKTNKLMKGITIRPDYNSSGHLTHYHIETN